MEDLVVVYDITDDSRRNRVCKILKGYGVRVQFSVFEVRVTKADEVMMQERLERAIDGDEDSIIIYRRCARCRDECVRIGQASDPYVEDVTII